MALDPLALLRMAVMRFPFVQSLSKDFNGNRVYSMYAVAVQRNPSILSLSKDTNGFIKAHPALHRVKTTNGLGDVYPTPDIEFR